MKLLAVVFGAIALLAAMLGFATSVPPLLSICGKIVALISLAGLAMTAGTTALDEALPFHDLDADDANRRNRQPAGAKPDIFHHT